MTPRQRTTGWIVGAVALLVYCLSLEPSVSFWDCGEYIATSYRLEVGHPPGAPFYQLLAHCFSWLAGNNLAAVAWCCNLLSAVAGAFTTTLLYWSIVLLMNSRCISPALIGALCYLFLDSVWFSAVESEVYSLAMLFSALIVWAALRWYRCTDTNHAPRWLILIAFLSGLGACVHLMVLLTLSVVLVALIKGRKRFLPTLRRPTWLFLALLLFTIGLTPYLIIPIRAAAHPPINTGCPEDFESFKSYIRRDQYPHAPLYPRLWRERDSINAAKWSGGDTSWKGNLRYYVSYQLGFMYGRYISNNFIARQNQHRHTTVYYIIPMALVLIGLWRQIRRRDGSIWVVGTLFFVAGPLLNFYLNHPCYEPRERDYVYVLSFFALCFWIAEGAEWMLESVSKRWEKAAVFVILALAPLSLAWGNWDDHDRSGRYIAHDAACNLLNSCDKGSILFTFGDNDTFPLWYLQQVELYRTDVEVVNINLTGYRKVFKLINDNIDKRKCYLSQYSYDKLHDVFAGHLALEGINYRLSSTPCDEVDTATTALKNIVWHDTTDVYVDHIGRSFIIQSDTCRTRYYRALGK